MNIVKTLFVAFMLSSSSAFADGFGFNLGPFNMQFGSSEPEYLYSNRSELQNPFCEAISTQKLVEFTVHGSERINANEKKMVTKTITIKPYAFGTTRDGQPVLRGEVVGEKLVKEVTVKFGDDIADDSIPSTKNRGDRYFTGKFNTHNNQNIDISRVSNIQIIYDSYFDIPENYKALRDDNVQIMCQLPLSNEL